MKPAAFEYVVAESTASAVAALAQARGEAKIIAGGQSLVPMLNFRLLRPAILIDINRIPNLAYVREEPDAVRIGALTRHHQLETSPVIARHLPVLTEAMAHVAHLAIRNRGTIGGSLSHADPAAELPMMAMLLDARLRIVSATATRTVAARDFFQDALSVDLADDELVTEVTLPKLSSRTGWGFAEVSRRSGDFALAAVAVTLTLAGDTIGQARIGVTGVAPTPRRVAAAEVLLAGGRIDDATTQRVIAAVRAAAEPQTDLHASSDYRRHLIGVLAGRALADAWKRAQAA
ncbi:MAG: xanthine dehydrogenase family protein subunit M [Alphaproteobacteria bacterium]|nr:xanthine dehydrogenase family protein subunit M [Alphaproteobacteria bacterium]